MVLLPALLLTGCVSVPQNADEYVSQISRAMIGATNKTEVVNVKYDTARMILRNKITPCLQGTVRSTTIFSNGARTVVDTQWIPNFMT